MLKQCIAQKVGWHNVAIRWLHKDGAVRSFESTASPMVNADGQITGFSGIDRDITERRQAEEALLKKAEELHAAYEELTASQEELRQNVNDLTRSEQALRESEVRFRSLFQNMDSLFSLYEVVLDEGGKPRDYRFIEINPPYEKFIGIPSSELIGRTLLEVFPLTESYWMDKFNEVYNTGIPSHFENDSQELDTYIELSIYMPQAGQIALISSDITERKRAEEALHLFKDLVEHSSDAIGMSTPDGRHYYQNEAFNRLFGTIGDNPPVSVYVDKAIGKHVFDTIMGGGNWQGEIKMFKADGTILDIFQRAYAIKNREGRIISLVGLHTDITMRKVSEEALCRVNQKLNILSQLTRKDLASQTFVLSSYLELAKNRLVGQGSILEILQGVDDAVRLVNETIEYSKDYQDMGVKPPTWQNVKMALLLGLSHISISEIKHSLETGDLEIFADPLLEKVCQRLFENSVKHGGHVTRIRVWHTVTPDEATIFFEDDGIGIPGVRKEQIFLRREGTSASRGSLIFVREILDITGITIREMGEPGMGARFELMVPKGAWRMEVRAD